MAVSRCAPKDTDCAICMDNIKNEYWDEILLKDHWRLPPDWDRHVFDDASLAYILANFSLLYNPQYVSRIYAVRPMAFRRKVLQMRIAAIVAIYCYVGCLFSGCSKKDTGAKAERKATSILTNVFGFRLTTSWSLKRAEGVQTFQAGDRKITEYFLVYQGSTDGSEEALGQLQRIGPSIIKDLAKLSPDIRVNAPWWDPDKQGIGYWTRLYVHTNSTHYSCWVYIFKRNTNSLFYSHITSE